MIKLTLEGNPLSTQSCYKSSTANGYNHTYMVAKCVTLKIDYQYQLNQQYKGDVLDDNLVVSMTIYRGNKRRADIDNFNKLVFDAMAGIIYKDDSQIKELHIFMDYDKLSPRIELEIDTLQ